MLRVNSFLFLAAGVIGCGAGDSGAESEAEDEEQNPLEEEKKPKVIPVDDNTIDPLDCTAGNCVTFVGDSAVMPTQSMPFDCDVDENGSAQNGLGNLLALISAMGSKADLQGSVDESILQGSFILLLALQADSFSNDPEAGLQTWQGADADDDWTNNTTDTNGDGTADALAANADFATADDSPIDLAMGGGISGGQMDFGPGRVLITLALPESAGGVAAEIEMYAVHITGPVTDEPGIGYSEQPATLCGGIPGPLFDALLVSIANGLCADDPESDGCQFVLDTLDTDKSGALTVEEVAAHPLRQSLLGNDLDLFIGEYVGSDTPRGTDGDMDSLSFGLGFTAIPANFATSSATK